MRAHGLAILVTIACALSLAACGSAGESAGEVAASASGAAAGITVTTTPTPKATKQPKRSTPKPTPRPTSTKTAVTGPATRIVFVDVGQGDAAIIRSGSWTGLIDGGPSGSEGAIESALRGLGVSRLDAVVVTHPHADHTGGLMGVAYDYRPRQAYVGEGAGAPPRRCAASGPPSRRSAGETRCALAR